MTMHDTPAVFPLPPPVQVRELGLVEYEPTWRAMQAFTQHRDLTTEDEIWYLQHPPVFTLGLNAKPEHLLNTGNISVVQIDRGGQVTYHGPGQLVIYLLLDLHRRHSGVKHLVKQMEQAVIDVLAEYRIPAVRRAGAPGIYVGDSKIAALGLRIRRGLSYHGLALNVDMDLEPFSRINPCGYAGMAVTQMADLVGSGPGPALQDVQLRLHHHLMRQLGYNGGHE